MKRDGGEGGEEGRKEGRKQATSGYQVRSPDSNRISTSSPSSSLLSIFFFILCVLSATCVEKNRFDNHRLIKQPTSNKHSQFARFELPDKATCCEKAAEIANRRTGGNLTKRLMWQAIGSPGAERDGGCVGGAFPRGWRSSLSLDENGHSGGIERIQRW
ncbi:hypothetical protein B0J12DRAFT_28061 [Macrophomina phaseolina]|uniref:Uncharacterized protein n=1 Tax=Macrophomina phaseolina TaxID=35725 RepID=A0ABQ8GVC3_9PEZI|nr:hypothetical protein B0J12DRAFT_28061 [Macrophomina phaseolina]